MLYIIQFFDRFTIHSAKTTDLLSYIFIPKRFLSMYMRCNHPGFVYSHTRLETRCFFDLQSGCTLDQDNCILTIPIYRRYGFGNWCCSVSRKCGTDVDLRAHGQDNMIIYCRPIRWVMMSLLIILLCFVCMLCFTPLHLRGWSNKLL